MNAPAKHTPGPFILGRSRDGAKVIVADSRTRTVAQFYRPERDADAALFLAAPDLLAALKGATDASEAGLSEAENWVHDQLDGTSLVEGALAHLQPIRDKIVAARAAVAKAEGGAA